MKQNELYEKVTNQIIELLQQHLTSWDKPWIAVGSDYKLAHNAATGNNYKGINQLLLSITALNKCYYNNGWLTFLQVQKLGGQVAGGEHSTEVYFFKFLHKDRDGKKYVEADIANLSQSEIEAKSIRKTHWLHFYRVFNVEQTTGLPEIYYQRQDIPAPSLFEINKKAEGIIDETAANVVYRPQDEAYYSVEGDTIFLPLRARFKKGEGFYQTVFHELAHWTGHSSRLNRPLVSKFGTEVYAREELVAELTSAFICASLGFTKTISNNESYLEDWLKVLRNDSRFIFRASSDAVKASEYILSRTEVAA